MVVSRSFDKIIVQSYTYLELSTENRNYTLTYIRNYEFDEQSYKNKFLQLLGGQVHVQCDVHKLSLINSLQKKNAAVIGDSSIFVLV